jgi:hypothetical protein
MSKILWQQSLKGVRSIRQRCPVVVNKTLLATFSHGQGSNFQGSLASIDTDTGEIQWKFDVDHYLNEPVIDREGFIYQTCFNGSVYKLNPASEICWHTQASTTNTGSGCLVNNLFVYSEIAGQAKFTRGLDCATGKILWEYEHGGHGYTLASDNHQYVVHVCIKGSFEDTTISLLCLDANTGKLIWQLQRDYYIFRPVIYNNRIYIGGRGNCLVIDLTSGNIIANKILEKKETVQLAPLLIDDEILFISSIGKLYLCHWQADQFVEKWNLDLQQEIKTNPIVHNKNLLVIREDGNLNSIDISNSTIITQTKIPNFVEGFGLASIDQDLIVSVSRDCVRMKLEA